MRTVLFEDRSWTRFLPLTALAPIQALRCGILPLWQRTALRLSGGLDALVARPGPAAAWQLGRADIPLNPDWREPALWLNARVLWDDASLAEAVALSPGQRIVSSAGDLLAAAADLPTAWGEAGEGPSGVLEASTEAVATAGWPVLTAWYHLLTHSADEIARDLVLLGLKDSGRLPDGVEVMGEKGVYLAAGCRLAPATIMDARHGPVILDEGVEVLPHSYLQGPCYVGPGSLVRAGTRLYEGCDIGPRCKVGGELERVLMQGYANKQHEGYLGNAVIAPWVNLGAGTNNSDLKNTYGPITTTVDGERVNTGLTFLGCCLGEHVKTSIGTILNTGTVAGVGCNLFGAGFHPVSVPDFVWGKPGRYREYIIEKVVETAATVMARREISMSREYEDLLREWFTTTSQVREEFLSRRMHGG